MVGATDAGVRVCVPEALGLGAFCWLAPFGSFELAIALKDYRSFKSPGLVPACNNVEGPYHRGKQATFPRRIKLSRLFTMYGVVGSRTCATIM